MAEAPVVFLMGPTASGKTAVAVELVQRFPFEIISVDSALVYRGMDIGTAKPEPHVLAQAPHRLIDIADPAEAYSAARFVEDARREIAQVRAAGRIPLLVGGTMLYFRALAEGLAPLPQADPALRAELEAEAARHGWEALHQRLTVLDPRTAARLAPSDPQRIQRALEVCLLSGEPMSRLLEQGRRGGLSSAPVKWVVAPAERAWLRERIAGRFAQMLAQGFVAEVEALRARPDLAPGMPSMRAVGYRQVWEYLEGVVDYAGMEYKGVVATRQFAKRQMTWLRRETQAQWFDPRAAGWRSSLARAAEQVCEADRRNGG
ncbi:tRNA (adenosine(37)-N6)-dimethylallyltransferase MiaA [Alkalilimnicola sp. S0819]|uniref:tRNA (adenosine(37)-N6)-dimethylallyltransferase MiaA n=1 Tax=Alkalilimnicola sp. S0819 TaxID=2613922 RepID=UPI001261DD67|nr:tRNA (adenosine(37)-N6)-dimethylallyltransferase MiaA [Alkalilimnicola sp. S0819]KAB7628352.1 tRNA (adenosine(37)-N6)-dimethylallyltransferase MiaA [Alkalilimnicola sp. S0819]MPQ15253.1 tRNA (adenosine(37)-N6)-dimethylallyltransferase MiaA [Alkalilimnicola sp. S0819]